MATIVAIFFEAVAADKDVGDMTVATYYEEAPYGS